MSESTTALVVAIISAIVALLSAVGVEISRRRSERQLEQLRSKSAEDLETLKNQLTIERESATKAEDAQRLVARYRDPLLRSAFDLQSRIYNILRPGGFRGRRDPEYFRLYTVFLFAQFFGWLEIIRRDMQFLDLGATTTTRQLATRLDAVQGLLASTSAWRDEYYIYRGEQRAIGELMITRVEDSTGGGPTHECLGYAAFVSRQADPNFHAWFERFGKAVASLPGSQPSRLVALQAELIGLIDFLDPDKVRFPDRRLTL